MESCSIWRTSWCSVAHDITCSWGQRNSAQSQDCSRRLLTLKFVQKALRNVATPNLNELYYLELSSQHKKTSTARRTKDTNYFTSIKQRNFRRFFLDLDK